MSTLRVYLFGRFDIQWDDRALSDFARRMQELFCYLLLYRDRPHSREALANLLWGDCFTIQSKKCLRQALWQLQSTLDTQVDRLSERVLSIESDWIQINPELDLWLDVAAFELAFDRVQEVPGRELDPQRAEELEAAVNLYRGDLLEGWYQDWCLYERERLQNKYLSMLDKLMGYCEAHRRYEIGLAYGPLLLHYDPAHERAHRRMMRLHYLAGNRTAALRQYERCIKALSEELGVCPAERTVALYEQIRAGQLGKSILASSETGRMAEETTATLLEALDYFKQVRTVLTNVQLQVQQGIQTVESAVNRQR